jgi:transposase-like protein
MVSFKGAHFEKDIILTCVRWYVAYPLSYRQLEELMEERGVAVDYATINRWVLKYSPQLEAAFHRRKQPVWMSWHLDETYIRVRGHWRYLYRAVKRVVHPRLGFKSLETALRTLAGIELTHMLKKGQMVMGEVTRKHGHSLLYLCAE